MNFLRLTIDGSRSGVASAGVYASFEQSLHPEICLAPGKVRFPRCHSCAPCRPPMSWFHSRAACVHGNRGRCAQRLAPEACFLRPVGEGSRRSTLFDGLCILCGRPNRRGSPTRMILSRRGLRMSTRLASTRLAMRRTPTRRRPRHHAFFLMSAMVHQRARSLSVATCIACSSWYSRCPVPRGS